MLAEKEDINTIGPLIENSANAIEDIIELTKETVIRNESNDKRPKIKLHKDYVNISELVHKVLNIFEENIKNKNIRVNIIQDSFTKDIISDKRILAYQIISNIISNSIKFSHRGGDIYITIESDFKNVKLSIKDSGVGLSPFKIEKIKRQSNSISTLGTEGESGTGTGLKNAFYFAKLLNIDIDVRSKNEKDAKSETEFILSIPIE